MGNDSVLLCPHCGKPADKDHVCGEIENKGAEELKKVFDMLFAKLREIEEKLAFQFAAGRAFERRLNKIESRVNKVYDYIKSQQNQMHARAAKKKGSKK